MNLKQDIRSKIDDVANHCEYLKTHIKDLKNGGEFTTQVCENIESMKELLRDHDKSELLESLEECLHFLEAKVVKFRTMIFIRPTHLMILKNLLIFIIKQDILMLKLKQECIMELKKFL
jgi:hypothetical protein